MSNQAQVLLKRSGTLGKLVNTQIMGIILLCTGKNIICISCVFNGVKYISTSFHKYPKTLNLKSYISKHFYISKIGKKITFK